MLWSALLCSGVLPSLGDMLETEFVITTPSHGAEPDEAASVTLSGVGNPPGEDFPVDQSAQWEYEQPGKGDNFLLFKIRLEESRAKDADRRRVRVQR